MGEQRREETQAAARPFPCPGHQSFHGCANEVDCLRASVGDYLIAQAHHMPESWRSWFMKRFRLVDYPPYGVKLAKEDADG